ncbi:alpha-L-fucosidase [Bacteroides xylanisolvens]|jgi:alpha-L-fucosidase|uniref:alpha-L-fucosidase n=1 Tax=Bacteroides xylanisolvens TaxID=371601 RepID=A0A7J5Q080_9BACE|nr:alpha-L-fucosidase [Bacteroides xylanisolvens]KAB6149026.1 alpha-L-fucosidase [Bacteroides xylanisolvens]MCA4532103.1 alpha-L-fucosidase [Bacteroides xylanisolvens]MCA4549980.1 alpha-L-fucosidase [Bacteroides xylanisolvens]MCA4563466.1 alpha-L-fucosidase [Bacteroides xylanisolvens]MCA4599106.1 alpha-L-fucosidase [Bacteroides xylanisolvens]
MMKKVFLVCLLLGGTLTLQAQTKYEPTWESLKQYKVPEWWKNTKFGIYFHWGPYSVPAYKTEWYSHWMYEDGHPIRKHHESTYGPLWKFGYKDFIPMFKAEKFDADAWAELFKKAGAQFAGPVAEHSDGFAMWDSKLTPWNAVKMGPKRDIVRLMQQAVKKQGMKFVVTYHRHWIYAWYPTWNKNTDAGDPKYAGLYGPYTPKGTFKMAEDNPVKYPDDEFNKDWLARLEELMGNYEPDIIWFDNRMDIIGEKYRKQFLADYYNKAQQWGKEVVCTYKSKDMAEGTAVLDLERSRMSDKRPFCWLTDDSIDWGAWCNVSDPNYKTTNRLIDFLVDVVSKNGAVLLNVTPTAEGVMPKGVVTRLLEMGEWLKLNGEAIYDTRPWEIYGEGPQRIVEGHLSENKNADAVAEDIRFTTRDGNLYAIALDWPADRKLVIRSLSSGNSYLKKRIKGVSMLGAKEKLMWKQTDKGLEVTFPEKRPCDFAYVLKLRY